MAHFCPAAHCLLDIRPGKGNEVSAPSLHLLHCWLPDTSLADWEFSRILSEVPSCVSLSP